MKGQTPPWPSSPSSSSNCAADLEPHPARTGIGGNRGGEPVVCGSPEEVARCSASVTGRCLRKYPEL